MSKALNRHLLRAKDLADAKFTQRLDVIDMAKAAGLSRAHFSEQFKKTFGVSPHAYLQARRLERATALLRNTDYSVAEICLSVGMTSVGSFTTSFSRTFGKSPTAYRVGNPPASRLARGIPSCKVRANGLPALRSSGESGSA